MPAAEAAICAAERDRLREALLPLARNPDGQPVLHAMAGIPGAGKSTFVAQERKAGRLPERAFVMNPDIVMTALEGYAADLESRGPQAAFDRWELPARAFAHELLKDARRRRLDVIQDMACARREDVETLRTFRADGYRVCVWYVECPVDVALERIARRMARTGRYTPGAMVRERAAAIRQLLPRIRAACDQFRTV